MHGHLVAFANLLHLLNQLAVHGMPSRIVGAVNDLPEAVVGIGPTVEPEPNNPKRYGYILTALPEISPKIGEPEMRELVAEMGLKPAQVFGVLRVAVTGQRVSPPLFESLEILGKELTLRRIQRAARELRAQG